MTGKNCHYYYILVVKTFMIFTTRSLTPRRTRVMGKTSLIRVSHALMPTSHPDRIKSTTDTNFVTRLKTKVSLLINFVEDCEYLQQPVSSHKQQLRRKGLSQVGWSPDELLEHGRASRNSRNYMPVIWKDPQQV